MPKVTIQQVKDSFSGAQTGGVVLTYVFRPLSFIVTPTLLRAGATPNAITVLGFMAGFAACGFFLNGSEEALAIGAGLYFISIVLDFVDGNIARLVDGATYFGKFLDSTVDRVIGLSIPITLSLGLLWQPQLNEVKAFLVNVYSIPFLTALTCALWMMQQAVAARYAALDRQLKQQHQSNGPEQKFSSNPSPIVSSAGALAKFAARFLEQLWEIHKQGVFFLLVPFGYVYTYLTIFCILGMVTSALRTSHTLYIARGSLNVKRTSVNQGNYLGSDR